MQVSYKNHLIHVNLEFACFNNISHDSSVGKWAYLTACPLRGLGSISSRDWVLQGIYPWLITLCQHILSQSDKNGSISYLMAPHNLCTLSWKVEVQPWTDKNNF